jgi:hypothetical protein
MQTTTHYREGHCPDLMNNSPPDGESVAIATMVVKHFSGIFSLSEKTGHRVVLLAGCCRFR